MTKKQLQTAADLRDGIVAPVTAAKGLLPAPVRISGEAFVKALAKAMEAE